MPVDTLLQLLQLALGVIGTLILLLISLIVYVFLSLKGEVCQVQEAVAAQGNYGPPCPQDRVPWRWKTPSMDHLERHDSQLFDHSQRIVAWKPNWIRGGANELP